MRRQRKPKPKQGDHQIVEIVRRDGGTTYAVQEYDWGWDTLTWVHVETFDSYVKAMRCIEKRCAEQIVSNRVVWP